METLLALWRGKPQIEQSSTTQTPESSTDESTDGNALPTSKPSFRSQSRSDRAETPKLALQSNNIEETSPQTTPKANATTSSGAVPSFSLSASPPASAAAIARTSDAASISIPKLSSAPVASPSTLMPPPPRPPRLNGVNNTSSLLSPAPARNSRPNSLASAARQPGTSTLAPPLTHSSKPSKPSRKVILEPGHSPLDWARLANSPTSDLRNLAAGTPYLKVTPSMLKKMTGRKGKDAWTALGGRVYNITPYLPFHPGGEPELMRCAGRDGTKLFGEIHPWVNYESMLATSLIGMLVEEGEEAGNGKMDEMD
ncbi:Cytochrome b5 reductase 4 [Seiridium cupressi]